MKITILMAILSSVLVSCNTGEYSELSGSWADYSVFVEILDINPTDPETIISSQTCLTCLSSQNDIRLIEKMVYDYDQNLSGSTLGYGSIYVCSDNVTYIYKLDSQLALSIDEYINNNNIQQLHVYEPLTRALFTKSRNIRARYMPHVLECEIPKQEFEQIIGQVISKRVDFTR
ncbi:hypothetical protein P4C99_01860 [Pontiellaceae bacterium B1224]|nr:hypothetical protein [Pontiellaceae bacterium B1224]